MANKTACIAAFVLRDTLADADYAFNVPARTGRKDPEVLAMALATAAEWMASVA